MEFITPSDAISKLKPVAELSVLHPISWADEARDTSAWLGNKLQNEAFNKLYSVAERVRLCTDRRLKQDWNHLQSSDHFFYMSTKHFNDGAAHAMFSPYETPYQAFTNYMNVLADFLVRVDEQYPKSIDNEELNALLSTINNQNSGNRDAQQRAPVDAQQSRALNEEHATRAAVAQGKKLDENLQVEEAPAKKQPPRKDAKTSKKHRKPKRNPALPKG